MTMLRLLGVWTLLAVLMTANGIFRELVLRDAFASTTAGIISAVLGSAIILAVTRYFFRPFASAPTRALFAASLALVLLTLGFETVIGRLVDHKSWSELAANYAIWRGALWPIVLMLIALTPFIWGRWFVRSAQ